MSIEASDLQSWLQAHTDEIGESLFGDVEFEQYVPDESGAYSEDSDSDLVVIEVQPAIPERGYGGSKVFETNTVGILVFTRTRVRCDQIVKTFASLNGTSVMLGTKRAQYIIVNGTALTEEKDTYRGAVELLIRS